MHSSGSLIRTIVKRARHYVDKATADVHSDEFLVSEVLMPVWQEFFQGIRLSDERELLMTMPLSLVAGQEAYELPPCVDAVVSISIFDEVGLRTHDKFPRGEWHPNGPGFYVQGNELHLRPPPQHDDEEWVLIYRPSAEGLMHVGTGEILDASDSGEGVSLVLDDEPELGQLDRRVNAYTGCVLRIIEDGFPIQERVIDSYDVLTRTATTRLPLQSSSSWLPGGSSSGITYEIAPQMFQSVMTALAARMAMHLAPSKGFPAQKVSYLESIYMGQLKAMRDRLNNTIERAMRHFHRDTQDNLLLLDESSLATLGRWSGARGGP